MRIVSFADPHPDELLYSACARLECRMRLPYLGSIFQVLFGSRDFSAVVDFASRVDYLISGLPPSHRYTSDILINDYTLWCLFQPFLTTKRAELVWDDMRSTN